MCSEEQMKSLIEDIHALIEANAELPIYEIGTRLIAEATVFMLAHAPYELLAINTALAGMQIGIAEYHAEIK